MHRFGGKGDVCTGTNVLMQQLAEIHTIKLVAAQDQIKIVRPLEKITHILPHRVRCPLIPLRAGGRLLSGENIHKAARKIVELVAGLDVPV